MIIKIYNDNENKVLFETGNALTAWFYETAVEMHGYSSQQAKEIAYMGYQTYLNDHSGNINPEDLITTICAFYNDFKKLSNPTVEILNKMKGVAV